MDGMQRSDAAEQVLLPTGSKEIKSARSLSLAILVSCLLLPSTPTKSVKDLLQYDGSKIRMTFVIHLPTELESE